MGNELGLLIGEVLGDRLLGKLAEPLSGVVDGTTLGAVLGIKLEGHVLPFHSPLATYSIRETTTGYGTQRA